MASFEITLFRRTDLSLIVTIPMIRRLADVTMLNRSCDARNLITNRAQGKYKNHFVLAHNYICTIIDGYEKFFADAILYFTVAWFACAGFVA